ncbi:hypothetical protein N7481_007107 [Penicillium waksmanii]|uniref:uncharacterized protein n=1 Tax=Penicillium waksmanii TaxID=69791 RepID=UPI002546C661|nr:uncharacterized protein N7481_007107 [Penicillium waksmanii]KAJ5979809.1 hypothetical protein N7481_007107 [Penicillium waksmanii]
MEIPSRVENRFGEARASGDGITFQAGVNTGTININRECPPFDRENYVHVLIVVEFTERPRKTPFLKVAYGATCDAANKEHVPSCLPGTRVEVLKEIQEWIDGGNPKKLYWLNGMAGTGKSTIAMTLARTYKGMTGKNVRPEKNVCLGATFCFSRGGGDLASASRFAATVAIQLAEVSLQLRKLIENVLEDNPRLDSLSVQEQWDKLIIQPLSVFYQCTPTGSISLLFVIDALDECNNAEDVNVLIRCLERVTQIGGANCRVFLTSRPDQPIKAGLGNCVSGSRESFVLHDIEKSIVDQDLNLYYRDQLSRIRMIMSSENDIFSESLIANLVERSHGLFIHAATVCRFVQNGGFLAVERLNLLAKSEKADNAEKELDKMYTTVLEYSFVSASDGLCPEEAEKIHQLFQRIVGAIITISDAMNSESLALLLGEKRERIDTILSVLNSVINVEENNNELIRILHPSFREYLLDAKRCTNNSYSILADDTHGYILTRCFDLLMSQLQRNPLRITQPGAKARDAEIETINRYISIPLQYSSRYWWNHFQKSSDKWRNNVPLLEFLQDKYLYWLECLAWIAQLGQAVEAMLKLNTIFVSHF